MKCAQSVLAYDQLPLPLGLATRCRRRVRQATQLWAPPHFGQPHEHCILQHRRRQQRKNNATIRTMLYITVAIGNIGLQRNADL